jgi:hypothetical protein
MLIRDNKFEDLTRQNIKNNHDGCILARLSASVSRRINAHLLTYGGRSHMSVHPKSRNAYTLRTSFAHAQFYRCVLHRKAATHN